MDSTHHIGKRENRTGRLGRSHPEAGWAATRRQQRERRSEEGGNPLLEQARKLAEQLQSAQL
jgi:hypothetical protein